MKTAILLLAATPAFAQIASRPTAAASVPSNAAPIVKGDPKPAAVRIPLSAFVNLERTFDGKIAALGGDNYGPVDLLGATRGIYLDGYGAVFTTELGLVQTPTINPFNSTITDAQKTRVHSAKVTRLPALRKATVEAVQAMAAALTQVPDTQQIILAVRLDYASWENTSGLPGLIVAKADRRSALAGKIDLQEQ